MTESSTTTSAPAASPRRLPAALVQRCRGLGRGPATAAGVLTAVALGAGAWVAVPTAAPAAAQGVSTRALSAAPLAAVAPRAHPLQPEQAAPEPALPRARDPFRPLLTPPDPAASAPVDAPPPASTPGAPQVGTPALPPTFVEPQPQPLQPQPVQPQVPVPGVPEPVGSGGAVTGSTLQLTRVEAAGDSFVAVITVDGAASRAAVGDSFGPSGSLLLLSLQQGPSDGQWTAVVQLGQGEPFDLVSGIPTRLQ